MPRVRPYLLVSTFGKYHFCQHAVTDALGDVGGLWRAQVPGEALSAYRELLSPEERKDVSESGGQRDRILSRVLVRTTLARYCCDGVGCAIMVSATVHRRSPWSGLPTDQRLELKQTLRLNSLSSSCPDQPHQTA